ncbi:PspA/IM30 family protein [Corynebacterium sp. MSK297]|uniref:PspA/IM30 family protein n=1 Tax=Corynebacterium sp. MSK297 TaxID=3050221 RepID=UPI00254E5EBB|nr:PspA/IM30 family protein [Corynebacterium sp. MSK297]MDK8846901.1 PspA/IM30 family protein [Corynebacterium sp. MSK297]
MANPISKGWKYLMASFDNKIDEHADPKVQIKQAADAAKQQHREISEQASKVIGNQKQLEMQLNRLLQSQEEYQSQAREALQAADKAERDGETAKAQRFTETAELIASQLVGVEKELEQTKEMYSSAKRSSEQAKAELQKSEARLEEQLNEVRRLEQQVDQTKMQEKTSAAMDSMNEQIGSNDSAPTLDGVRDKIERRYANALGAQELSRSSASDAMAEISSGTSTRDIKASAKLDEIRASMGAGAGSHNKAIDSAADNAGGNGDVDSADSTDDGKSADACR